MTELTFSDDTNDGDQNPVKALRDANKALKKELDEARETLSGLRAESRTRTVRDALTDLGVNPKVAKFFPSDADATPEKVAEWAKENVDLFGPPAAPQTAPVAPEMTGGTPTITPEARDAWQRLQSQGSATGATPADLEQQQLAALAAMSAAAGNDPDAFRSLLLGETKLPSA